MINPVLPSSDDLLAERWGIIESVGNLPWTWFVL
jgi:hypothetical protein